MCVCPHMWGCVFPLLRKTLVCLIRLSYWYMEPIDNRSRKEGSDAAFVVLETKSSSSSNDDALGE